LQVSVATGMPVELALSASAGAESLEEALSRSRLKRNGLSFLLNLA
jgi:hypothetical protein